MALASSYFMSQVTDKHVPTQGQLISFKPHQAIPCLCCADSAQNPHFSLLTLPDNGIISDDPEACQRPDVPPIPAEEHCNGTISIQRHVCSNIYLISDTLNLFDYVMS